MAGGRFFRWTHCHLAWNWTCPQPQRTPIVISKLPIAKTLQNLRNSAKQKIYLRNLAKLVFTKPCKTLRYEHKAAKLVFEKPCENRICKTLQNNAKPCETLIAKIAKVAKVELHCKTMIQVTKQCKQLFYNCTFTAGRETMLRQTHWDATISDCRQSPVPYHKKHLPLWYLSASLTASRSILLLGATREALGGTGLFCIHKYKISKKYSLCSIFDAQTLAKDQWSPSLQSLLKH